MATHTDVIVKTNSFKISRLPTKQYIQYDGLIPDIPIPNKRQRVIHLLQTSVAPNVFNPRGVYDGKSLLYVSQQLQLPGGGATFVVHLGNDPTAPVGSFGVIEVVITRTASELIRPMDLNKLMQSRDGTVTIDRKAATAINLLQLLIRQSSNQNNPTNNGRAYFSPHGKKTLAGGIELWRGFFQSVRPTINQMLVTIDTSMAAVYESGALIDVAMHVLGVNTTRELMLRDERDPNFRKLQTYLKNRLIKTKTTGDRTKTIRGIISGPIGAYTFEKDGRTMSIEEYFYKAYRKVGQEDTNPRLLLSGRTAPFPVIVPAELCMVIPGQLYKKRLPSTATTNAVDFATMTPQVRFQTIVGSTAAGVQSPIQGYNSSEFIHDAGMFIDPQPITLKAKLLAAPAMQFAAGASAPNNGSWNVMRQRFKNPRQMQFWGVVDFQRTVDPQRVIQDLRKCCHELDVAPPIECLPGDGFHPDKALNALVRAMNGPVEMIIVLLPQNAEEIRTRVKFWGDVMKGIRTSCFRENKLRSANNQLNARLGGQYALPNSIVLRQLKASPFMIFGADVAHPGPGQNRPSIASVVWSYDEDAASYVAYSEVQAPRQEIIQGLQEMVTKAILEFGNKIKMPPSRIIFYRDGVSEGELEKVKTFEIAAIKAACQDIWKRMGIQKPLPKVTFIVVVKRHHTVFFPGEQGVTVDDGKGNCRAGLVVDALRSPIAKDFYLLSHGAIKGTSRSGHYSVLLDEIFNEDISRLLCHVYAKATRSISIPAPVYCLVCARAKFHIDPSINVDFDASTNASGSDDFDLAYWKNAYRPVSTNGNYDKLMYFL
ncbi:ribonuclease H-like domain-containing protein [Mycena epipterygia]|nr:ribonuclease H-like domain-containing protein [Mycena epipterygia]